MSNDIAVFGNLTVADLTANRIAMTTAASSAGTGGARYLKMSKGGTWSANNQPAPTELAVDPTSFIRGWIAWEEGEKMGEVNGLYHKQPPRPEDDLEWQEQVGFNAVELGTGEQFMFRSSAIGAQNAVAALVKAVFGRSNEDLTAAPVALITLGHESYRHKQYGTIFNPRFDVTRFVAPGAVTISAPPTAAPPPAPEPASPTGRRPRRMA